MAYANSDRKQLLEELNAAKARVAELERQLELNADDSSTCDSGIPSFGPSILERSHIVFWMRNVDTGAFESVSKTAQHCLGYPAEQLLDDASLLDERVHPKDTPAAWELTQLDSPDHLHEEEIRYFHPDGGVRWLWSRTQGAFDQQGKLTHLIGIIGDCTNHRQEMELYIEQSDLLQSVLDSIHSAIFLMDTEGRYTFINKHYATLFGGSTEELAGKSPAALYDPATAKEFLDSDKLVIETRKALTSHETLPVDGELRNFLTTKAPVFDEAGNLVGICGMAVDITEQKKTENALREMSELLDSIMDYSSSYIFIKNNRGEYVRANKAFADDISMTPEGIAGKTDFDIFEKEQAQLFRSIDKEVTATQKPQVFESSNIITGEKRQLLTTCFPLRDAHDNPNGVCVICTDVTDQHAAAEAIAVNEKRFRAIIDSVDRIAIQGYDENRRVIFWNPSSERLYGYTHDEALGQQLEDLIIPDHMREAAIRELNQWMDHDIPIPSGELILRNKHGDDVHVYSSHVMYRTPDGRREMFCVDVDLAETKRMEHELTQAKDAAESASRAKSEFLANMSHEIRTPLNGIMGMLQLMTMEDLSGEQSKLMDIALTSCRNLTRLLSDILDLSRVEAGKMELVEEDFSINEIIETLRPTYGDEARRKGVELNINVDPAMPGALIGDPIRLRQILMNLVGNAIKFTEEGAVSLDIRGVPGNEPPSYTLIATVRDTGIGISQEQISIIFEPFAQLESAYKRKFQGAGLGLSIVKRLIQLMGGKLTVESELGEGTTIQFSAPFTIEENQKSVEAPVQLVSKSGVRLLLVEDEPINCMALRKLLEREGYEVLTATSGQQALDMLAKEPVDIILMDIQMPGMDGLEATRRIRQGAVPGLDKRIPVIALTAYAMAGDRETFLQAGMNDYAAKPVDINDLNAILKRFTQTEE